MKKLLTMCVPVVAAVLWMAVSYEGGTLDTDAEVKKIETADIQPVYSTEAGICISDLLYRSSMEYSIHCIQLDDADMDILLCIASSEAGTEDVIGKALVMRVVLNRVASEEFPDTIKEVVFQKRQGIYQFSPVGDGSYQDAEITSECFAALDMILDGWDESGGATYFCTPEAAGKWHEQNLTYLFQHGRHYFYTDREGEGD